MTDSQDTAPDTPAQDGSTVSFRISYGAPVVVPQVHHIVIETDGAFRYVTVYRTAQSTIKFSGFGELTMEAL